MEIIATIPPPYMAEILEQISGHPYVDGVRFNVGARSNCAPLQTLKQLLDLTSGKEFWLDIKGRQLRITRWARPTYADIVLNHSVEVDLPAKIIFRDGEESIIREINGNKIYVSPNPPKIVGEGQSINIHGSNLKIDGYLTPDDTEYLLAARELGIKNIMLSFVEEFSDIQAVLDIVPNANLVLKIESPKGLELIETINYANHPNIHLMAARDDLLINLEPNRSNILAVTKRILELDNKAIVASRILTSLVDSNLPSLGDICDLAILQSWEYRRFMLSDSLCFNLKAFDRVMDYLVNQRDAPLKGGAYV